jgi:DNA-binding transcriptional MerR regulator
MKSGACCLKCPEALLATGSLLRLVLKCSLFGREIKHTAYEIITMSAHGSYMEALECAERLRALLQNEYRQAEEAVRFLEQWGKRHAAEDTDGHTAGKSTAAMSRNEAAKLLDVTPDMLRDWERNGLIDIPRDPRNGYRIYGEDEINKLRVIRALRRSNYSNMAILRAVRTIDAGSAEDLRQLLDSPEADEERGYLCFADTLLTSLQTALDAVCEVIRFLKDRSECCQ